MKAVCSFHKTAISVWKKKMLGSPGPILAALALALAPAAFGSKSGLPAACVSYSIPGIGNQNLCGANPGSYSSNYSGGAYTAAPSVSPNPAASVSVNPGNQPEGADASVEYYVEFSGPTATVPIQVNASASASGAASTAELLIEDLQDTTVYLNLVASTNGQVYSGLIGSSPTFNGPCSGNALGSVTCGSTYVPGATVSNNLIWTAQTNVVYDVYLDANSSNGSASVDPTFSIASSVPGPQNYSILLSDGIGNSPASTAAPEPASTALLVSGIGGLLCFARRKLKR